MITYFTSLSNSKIPISPYGNNAFKFTTIDIDFFSLPYYFEKFYILNRKYNINNLILPRNKSSLNPFLTKETDFVVLDIDNILNEDNVNQIYNILKANNYTFFLIPSRSYSKGKYNLKGAIKVKGKNKTSNIIAFLNKINLLIKGLGDIDLSSSREASFQAPTLKLNFILKHEGGIKELPDIIEHNTFETNNEILKEALNIALSKGFTIYKEQKDLYVLEHHNEKTKRGYFIYKNNPYVIHHFNRNKSINIYKELIQNEKILNLIKTQNEEKIKSEFTNLSILYNKKIDVNQRYLNVNIDDFDILLIKSPMGTGKTNVIKNIMKKHKDKRFLFVTNRRSLSYDIKNKFNASHYLLDADIKQNHIIQYDSLWQIDIKEFDYIVLDEFISLLLHTFNDLTNKFLQNRMKLFSILFNTKFKLILADAFLGVMPKFNWKRNKVLIENKYRDDIDLYQYKDRSYLFETLYNTLQKEKVTLSINNKKLAHSLYNFFITKGFKAVIYDGSINDTERREIEKTLKMENPPWDILIYTPAITTGIDILCNINNHFHYDDGTSQDVISSLQKLKRNRNAKEIHFYINGYKRNVIIDKKTLEQIYLENSVYTTFDDYGNVKLDKRAEFFINLEILKNKLEVNHKIAFINLLKEQFNKEPILIEKKSNFLKKLKKYQVEVEKNYKMYNFSFSNEEEEKKIQELSKYHKQAFYLHLILKKKLQKYYYTIINLGKTNIISEIDLLMKYKDINLKYKFTKNDIKQIGNEFKNFLKLIGYEYDRKCNSYIINKNVKWLEEKLK